MVPLKLGTLSPGLWSVLNCGEPKTMVWLSFSPDPCAACSSCASSWCRDCSSWARPASKSASLMRGADEGSVPWPVAWGFVTETRLGAERLSSMVVIVWSPTLPVLPGMSATTLAVAVPFQGTKVLPEVCANSRPFVVFNRWPLGKTRPAEPHCGLGHLGAGRSFV